MKKNVEVTILLAAYNGGAYIRPMIESILNQDQDGWKLILSDDGNGTVQILQEYADRYPDKIVHYASGQRFGSAQKHFMHLLRAFGQDTPYCMFCDQDDVWHPDKVRKTLELMKKTETDPDEPVMVHTDLRVVDGTLVEISPSFVAFSGIRGENLALNQLLVQNVVTGCTMMINRSLAKLADRDIPGDVMLMHDWWLALLASCCGKAAFLPEATIDYRQHGNNTVGAKDSRSPAYILSKLRGNIRGSMIATGAQAGTFAACYADMLSPEQTALLRDFADSFQKGKLFRISVYFKYHLWKNGLHRKLGQLIWG